MCKKATSLLWTLVRFKEHGATTTQIVITYKIRIRYHLEFASPVYHSSLTAEQSQQIERVQKKALAVILGSSYMDYDNALAQVNLERLDVRRLEWCRKFANNCVLSPKHSKLFPLNPAYRPKARTSKPFLERFCRTSRHYNSAIPFLTRLLNSNH